MAKKKEQKTQEEQQKNSSIGAWLRKIASKLTASIILTFATVVIAALAYYHSVKADRPAQITVEYMKQGAPEMCDMGDIRYFRSLFSVYDRTLNVGFVGLPGSFGMPRIINNEDKVISHLDLTVRIDYPMMSYYPGDINSDFEVVKHDSVAHTLLLKYKYDYLNAHSAIPMPLSRFILTDPTSRHKTDVRFYYAIVYEGIKSTKYIDVWNTVYFYSPGGPDAEVMSNFLDTFVYPCDQGQGDQFFVSIIGPTEYQVHLPKKCSKKSFEDFKQEVIQDISSRFAEIMGNLPANP